MKATETKFLPFLQGTKQFIIPIYQRTYSWTLPQCQQLWDDVRRAGLSDYVSGHFVGSIVYIERGLYQVTAVPQLLVIDGQQRITTLSLMLAALGRAMEERGALLADVTRRKVNNYYLVNNDEDGDLRYKLMLTQSDKDTLVAIIEDRELPPAASPRVTENYNFFLEQLRKPSVDLAAVYNGLGKLIIVDIALDRERDNPQLIFESLNSTGLKLSQADLIRNYILMGLDSREQADLYQRHWFPMEQGFGHAEYAALFDRFMRDYLTIKTGRIPNIGDVYTVFKAYAQADDAPSVAELVADVHRYSKHFVRLAFGRDEDEEISRVLSDINTLRVDVAYPFLMEVYDDYERRVIDRSVLLNILGLVESYVFRRVICGIPTNSLNKTFANLMKEVNRDSYLESVQAALAVKDSYRRFPDDEEFVRELVVKDVYSLRNRNYLLRKLENHGRKEWVDVESYTIEHVMPQNPNLSAEWQADLGPNWQEVQAKYLHTVGNLTLTGYNSELSDRPFVEKRNMPGGFADSPIRLNRGLANLERWDEREIQRRAEELAKQAVEVWPYPAISAEALRAYRKSKGIGLPPAYSLETHAHYLQGEMLSLFEELRKRILNLDSSVREEFLKLYIAYKAETNFVDVIPQKSRLLLVLNMRFDELEDPAGLCRDITGLGRWGNGDVETSVASLADVEAVMPLIRQSYERQREEV
jgi:uncharacterized protein with ParB-like and HNH nuclease domain/predicted transport protein